MKAEHVFKIAGGALFALAVATAIAFVMTLDRPLGEGYKQAKDYGGEFTLQSDKGTIRLSDLKGKVVVIYFGFVSCRDACPISLAKMRTVFNRLSEDELKKTQGIFISIDPERDTPETMAAYIKNYHPTFIGLTDTREKIDVVLKQYGVFAKPEDLNGESTTYTVDHSSRFYMIDKEGKLLTTLSHTTTPAELVAKIRTML